MILRITPEQSDEVNRLVTTACCNCVDGNCLLLDDSEERQCVQLISRYGIYCNHLLNAVLPTNKELYEELLKQNGRN